MADDTCKPFVPVLLGGGETCTWPANAVIDALLVAIPVRARYVASASAFVIVAFSGSRKARESNIGKLSVGGGYEAILL